VVLCIASSKATDRCQWLHDSHAETALLNEITSGSIRMDITVISICIADFQDEPFVHALIAALYGIIPYGSPCPRASNKRCKAFAHDRDFPQLTIESVHSLAPGMSFSFSGMWMEATRAILNRWSPFGWHCHHYLTGNFLFE